jgi:DNA excision repair protein ERCC-4
MKTKNLEITIITDTREQTPLMFATIPSERGTLATGDYSLKGFETVFSIERKTIPDLVQSVTSERERFFREMQRLKGFEFKRLLIIGTRSRIEAAQYRSMANPKAILASVATIEARFDVPAVYASDEIEAAAMIEAWAHYWTREQDKQGQAGTNTPTDSRANLEHSRGLPSDATNEQENEATQTAALGTPKRTARDTSSYGVASNKVVPLFL